MRARSALVAVCMMAVLPMMSVTSASAGSSGSVIHDGAYGMNTNGAAAGYSTVALTVVANGRKLLGGRKNSAVDCTVAPSLVNVNQNTLDSITVLTIIIPTLPISAAGTFSYSGNAQVDAEYNSSIQTFTLPMTISGRIVKGPIVAKRTTAAVVTFSAPAICAAETPTRFLLKWYP
jgi:hypothetical protein